MEFAERENSNSFNNSIHAHTVYFSIRWKTMAMLVLLLPLVGFFTCVLLALVLHFKRTTDTHCQVANYLPSVSAAIGGNTPEKYIWRICIALHCTPRLMVALAYYNFHMSGIVKFDILYKRLSALVSFLHILENSTLVGLTYISSTENHDLHELLFILFVISSQGYMILTCRLFHLRRNGNKNSIKDTRSYYWKKFCLGVNSSSLILAAYFFYRHNKFCEPGIYTIFSILEYFVILSNLAFHSTAIWDMDSSILELHRCIDVKDN